MTKHFGALTVACGFLVAASAAQAYPSVPAPLEGRTITGARVDAYDPSAVMEYDPNLNLTWLRDWNMNGKQYWWTQMAWVQTLHVGAFTNWSLPTALNQDGGGPCLGEHCIGNPMGYMYYVELSNPTGGPLTNTGPFHMADGEYWTGTEYPPIPDWPGQAWEFLTFNGQTDFFPQYYELYAAAVRPGDVAAVVPEPETWAMLLSGMALLAATWHGRLRQRVARRS